MVDSYYDCSMARSRQWRNYLVSAITLDAATSSRFRACSVPTVLRDENGDVLGQFVPEVNATSPYTPPPLDQAEIQRRLQGPRYSTAEVLAMLEKLDVPS
jgi:hypothetical protein